MKRVVIESPFSGDVARNTRYARLCMADCFRRGEAPYASHLLLTQVLDDEVAEERKAGMAAGFAWGDCAELAAVYTDLGVSVGMQTGIDRHVWNGIPVERRTLPADLMAKLDAPNDLEATLGALGPDELRVMLLLGRRLLAGQIQYGKLNIATDARDWRKERAEEVSDLLMYSAFEELRRMA